MTSLAQVGSSLWNSTNYFFALTDGSLVKRWIFDTTIGRSKLYQQAQASTTTYLSKTILDAFCNEATKLTEKLIDKEITPFVETEVDRRLTGLFNEFHTACSLIVPQQETSSSSSASTSSLTLEAACPSMLKALNALKSPPQETTSFSSASTSFSTLEAACQLICTKLAQCNGLTVCYFETSEISQEKIKFKNILRPPVKEAITTIINSIIHIVVSTTIKEFEKRELQKVTDYAVQKAFSTVIKPAIYHIVTASFGYLKNAFNHLGSTHRVINASIELVPSTTVIFSIFAAIEFAKLVKFLQGTYTISNAKTDEREQIKNEIFKIVEAPILKAIKDDKHISSFDMTMIEGLTKALINHTIDFYWDKNKKIDLTGIPAITSK